MNFLQLVNETIKASGVSLDALTSSNFATNTDPLVEKIKDMVRQAWREVQMERGEWEFSTRTKSITLGPRLLVHGLTGSLGVYSGEETEATVEVIDFSPTTAYGPDVSHQLGCLHPVGFPKLGEFMFNGASNYEVIDYAKYDLGLELGSQFSEPLLESIYVQEASNTLGLQDDKTQAGLQKVEVVTWSTWADGPLLAPSHGKPKFATVTPDGFWRFWPYLDKLYTLNISYNSPPAELTQHTDLPEGLAPHYHWVIVWRAVLLWAQYDNRPLDEQRAYKNYRFYKRQMDRYLKPSFNWAASKYDYYY